MGNVEKKKIAVLVVFFNLKRILSKKRFEAVKVFLEVKM
jgi:hypothetical protein